MPSKTITDHSTQPTGSGIKFIYDKSFKSKNALSIYHPLNFTRIDFSSTYMPEDYTKDIAKRMHYAGFRFLMNPTLLAKGTGKIPILNFVI